MARDFDNAEQKTDNIGEAKSRARQILLVRGNCVKLVLAILFSLGVGVAVSTLCDTLIYCFAPEEYLPFLNYLKTVLLPSAFTVMLVPLLRFGIRMCRGKTELWDYGRRGEGSGVGAYAAMCIATLFFSLVAIGAAAASDLVLRTVRAELGNELFLICLICVVFLTAMAMSPVLTVLFLLPAVSERKQGSALSLIAASGRASNGHGIEIFKFVFSFLLLTLLSVFSLGILFFVYVLPHYILSYGEFCSRILDTEDL